MTITIGEVSKRTGVGVQTVRFYEREGLLATPDRNSSGYRAYDETVFSRLAFIRRAQELGFSLKEVRELLDLQDDNGADCNRVRTVAEEKLHAIETKIADLNRMKGALSDLIGSCHGVGTARQCEIIECLSKC